MQTQNPTPDTGNSDPSSKDYDLVRLPNDTFSIHDRVYGETYHPQIGPVEEAEALYVRQLNLAGRLKAQPDQTLVFWDVGLGAAANPLTVLSSLQNQPGRTVIHSFDRTLAPLRFALAHQESLDYLQPYQAHLETLASRGEVQFKSNQLEVVWKFHEGDFPALIQSPGADGFPAPHAILFDAHSPAKNPAMWTTGLFTDLYRHLDPERPCLLPTYSRSTMLRVTLMCAGFYVGVGHATGPKEETTLASNSLAELTEPLDEAWLKRARASTSAEPMVEPVYRQAPLTAGTLERLQKHPQFR